MNFIIQAKSKGEVNRQLSTNPHIIRKRQTVERKQSKQPLQGQFSILSQFSTGQAYLNSEQQRTILGVRHSSSSILNPTSGNNHKNKLLAKNKSMNPTSNLEHHYGGRLSPASSASTLKEPSEKAKQALERKNAYDNISTNSNDDINNISTQNDTSKLIEKSTSKHHKKSSSLLLNNQNSILGNNSHAAGGVTTNSNLKAIKENENSLNPSTNPQNSIYGNRPKGASSIKNMFHTSDHSLIAASFKQSLTSLKSGNKNEHSNLKSKLHKSKKKNVVMVDCASQTDFPWTEEDEKREKKRRKRERAEMRKQMYLMKNPEQAANLSTLATAGSPEKLGRSSLQHKHYSSSSKHNLNSNNNTKSAKYNLPSSKYNHSSVNKHRGQANLNYDHNNEESVGLRS